MGISKQTYGINKRLLPEFEDWQIQYIPHGIESKKFFIVDEGDTIYRQFLENTKLNRFKFKILYSNRNIRRKCPGDVLMAYKCMMDKLTPEQRKECVLVWHSAPVDENGTDIKAVQEAMCPDYPVLYTYEAFGRPFNNDEMNYLFNAIDVYINMASNEGFGLGSCEALNVGKPIVVNVTGGLQDQCGFKGKDGNYLTAEDYIELGSNHAGTYKEHGEWVKPIYPTNRSLQGSPQTPYIFDDRCSFEDAGEALLEWYNAGPEERERCGKLGYEFVKDKTIGMDSIEMGNRFVESMNTAFEKWKPREKYTLEVI